MVFMLLNTVYSNKRYSRHIVFSECPTLNSMLKKAIDSSFRIAALAKLLKIDNKVQKVGLVIMLWTCFLMKKAPTNCNAATTIAMIMH